MNDSPSFLTLIWLFPFALALHEVEEWNIMRWYRRNFVELPPKTNTTTRTFLVFTSVLGFVWTGLAALWNNPSAAAWVLMPYLAVSLQNTLQHLYWWYLFREYPPGLATAALLLAPVIVALSGRALADGLVPVWYVLVLAAIQIPGLVDTVKARNRLSSSFTKIHHFSAWLGKLILPGIMNDMDE